MDENNEHEDDYSEDVNKDMDSRSQRRIRDGEALNSQKRYLMYFVKSEKSPRFYSGWTCGGALVNAHFVLTSAACVEDVQYLYAIAGYKKFVPYEQLDNDPCTKEFKKKVVYTCIPKAYEFDYAHVEKWSAIDIAVAQVESAFKMYPGYEKVCSYMPQRITINYDPRFQEAGIDAIVMGWGHLEKWRQPGDEKIYLQKEVRYAATRIMNKKKCKEHYADYPDLQKVIDKYMICTMERGSMNDEGVVMNTPQPTGEGCSEYDNPNCQKNFGFDSLSRKSSDLNLTNHRRQGICQNDHGGPLVTWVGSREYLIGVASVFRVNAESKCEGPYLYTSTQCNGAFINCIIKPRHRRSDICDLPARERGFEMIHKYISWANHSDGPADNERIQIRPQVPIRDFA